MGCASAWEGLRGGADTTARYEYLMPEKGMLWLLAALCRRPFLDQLYASAAASYTVALSFLSVLYPRARCAEMLGLPDPIPRFFILVVATLGHHVPPFVSGAHSKARSF